MAPSNTLKSGPQGQDIQVRASSRFQRPVSEVHSVLSNKDVDATLECGNQGQLQ